MTNLRSALVLAVSAAFFAVPAEAETEFSTVVVEILDSQTDGPLASMDAEKRSAMTACVVATLEQLPDGKKRHIAEGADFAERERRFGIVVDENHSQWRKKIAGACAEIAMSPEGELPEGVTEAAGN